MEFDLAIIYFGLTRSVEKTHLTHEKHIFDILKKNNLKYKTFIHTWKTKNNKQNIWDKEIPQKINYLEYKLLSPDFYKLDSEDEFLESINMNNYYYQDIWEKKQNSEAPEWSSKMVSNHLCMLESQKRGLEMVKSYGDKFKFIMFIRPDITIHNNLPVEKIFENTEEIYIPNHGHFGGFNDQFAILNNENAQFYGNRINEIAEFRKNNGRIVGEKYCKFIINKYNMKINMIDFQYTITRP